MQEYASHVPWVAFCISTYKRPDFLKKQLESLSLQTFKDFEVVVSDNDPDQSAKVIVEGMGDARFKYISNTENLGIVKSFNRSLENAHAEYITMLTDDDPVYVYMLETLYKLSQQYAGYGMYFGGNDRSYSLLAAAKLSGARVGTNSQLAELDEGTIRIYSAREFPTAYLNEDFGGGILWSVGIVKREIIQNLGGLPDYGSPNMADCAYVLLSGSIQGAVFINSSLGSQNIHQNNYSFNNANYTHFSKGVAGFYESVKNKLSKDTYTKELDLSLKNYTARTILSLLIFAKRNIQRSGVPNASFENCIDEIFSIGFMKKWKLKYLLAIYAPFVFSVLIYIKTKILKR